ncbi:MAG: YraN family protein [Chloroflexi bacterium]|nr:YraN family protein [Chloroflexota bacterium]MCH7952838.1 YraN family protein [Chloroflexota bacterium]MCI0783231.1 YraN family protein [Chloroflexota bacterium]MCI0817916.1 YraN family protein [Chloroflexota bacterium]MCI0820317.1 YraN family protein [Chloroflexota bacterium]
MARDNGRRALGELGERLAGEHLKAKGYRIRERNFRTAAGEIDIVAEAGGVLAFVEVKCRRGSSMGTAAESLSPAKQRRMVEMAEAYGQAREDLPEQWRIDLIAIDFESDGRLASLVHYENAVTADV